MLRRYDEKRTLRDVIKKAIAESRIEYKFLGLTYAKDGVKLKSAFKDL